MKPKHQTKMIVILGIGAVGLAVVLEHLSTRTAASSNTASAATATAASDTQMVAADPSASSDTATGPSPSSDSQTPETAPSTSSGTQTAATGPSTATIAATTAPTPVFGFTFPPFPGFGLGLFSPSASTAPTTAGATST